MPVIQIICTVLTLCYAALILLYRAGWKSQKTFTVPPDFTPSVFISIIIPARDEEKNIGTCIDSILKQDYPSHLREIIVVDDHSTDNTAAIVNAYQHDNIKCINLSQYMDGDTIAYKKKALSVGIAKAGGALIITTDADCIAPSQWLLHIAAMYETGKQVMIAGPVDFTSDGSLLQVFQSLDFMSMQGITAATHYLKLGNMGNGANLAFSKTVYHSLGGYTGTEHLASGDDYLLMMKFRKAFPARVDYLRSPGAIIRTAPQYSWQGFLRQRIRWASKSGKYDDDTMTAILSLVYLFNLSFVFLVIAGLFNTGYLWLALTMLLVKTIIELVYLYPVAAFFGKKKQLWVFPFLQPLHILYIVSAGFLGFMGGYEWKGRKVR